MTVLADFNIIIPEDPQDVLIEHGKRSPLGTKFNAGGRLGEGSGQTAALGAFIMFSVLNLPVPLVVFVNDEETAPGDIGTMESNPVVPGVFSGFHSQVLCMSGGRLKSGDGLNNEISVALPSGIPPMGAFHFMIKNLICFYHQDSD